MAMSREHENRFDEDSPGEEDEDFPIEEVDVDPSAPQDVQLAALAAASRYAIAGLIAAVLFGAGGVILIALGANGSVSLDLGFGKGHAKIVTSVIGLVVLLFGVFLAHITRLQYRIRGSTSRRPEEKRKKKG